MYLPRQATIWRSCRRKICAGVVLVAYLAAVGGFPLPGAAATECAKADVAKPQCGCCAAARAGRQCCCCATAQPKTETEDGAVAKSCCASPRKQKAGWPLIGASQCQRATTAWITPGDVCPGPSPIVWCPYLLPIDCINSVDNSIQSLPFAPPDPPPRSHGI